MSAKVAATYAGCRQANVARSTGTLVLVLDGGPAGLDTEGGRWYTVCEGRGDEVHGGLVSHYSLDMARAWAAHPEEWCPYCAGEPFDQHDPNKESGGS